MTNSPAKPLNSISQRFWSSSVGNWSVTALSAIACGLGLWVRLPGMVLAGLTPDWPLIWVICWSVNRTAWQGAFGGLVLGLLQDALTQPYPSHAVPLVLVGAITARLQKQRFLREDFISVALIVFGMVVVAETITALQWSLLVGWQESNGIWVRNILETIWTNYQTVTLHSALISSLWAPAVYLPLSLWWRQFEPERPENLPD